MVEMGQNSSLLCVTPLYLMKSVWGFLLQGLEFIQFLQQEYLPSLQVSPEITQVSGDAVCTYLHSASLSLSVRAFSFAFWLFFFLPFSQELCQVLQQPDTKVLKNYMKVSPTLLFSNIVSAHYDSHN